MTPDPPLFLLSLSVLLIQVLFTIISPSSINRLYRYYDITHMPAQTLVFSEQFTSTCVFRTICLLECFTLSLGWQWSVLSTLFPGLDFLTALSLSLSLIPSFRVFLPPSPPPRLTLRGSLSLSCDISHFFSRSFAHSSPPLYRVFYLFWVLSRSFSLVHSLSPGSGSSFLSHSYLSGLTVSLARARARALFGLPFLWVRFPHSDTQSFFQVTQSSLLNLSILISHVSLSLALAPRVPHSHSLNLELPALFVRLLTRSCSCSHLLPHARARSLSLDLEVLYARSLSVSRARALSRFLFRTLFRTLISHLLWLLLTLNDSHTYSLTLYLSLSVQVNDRQRSLVSPCVLLPIHHVCIVRGPPLVSC